MKNYESALKLEQKYTRFETMLKHATPEVAEILEKRQVRIKKSVSSVKSFCNSLIKNKMQKIANALPDEGYSMGSVVKVRFNILTVRDDRTSNYAKSCSYRANHGSISIKLTLDELKNIKVEGSLVTYIYPNQRNKVKKCWWFDSKGSKQHFELIKTEGYVYAGYHSTSKLATKTAGERNVQHRKDMIKLEKELKKKHEIKEKKYKKALRLQYSFQDSVGAGNCEVGTKAFILRLKLNSNLQYRGSFLLKKAKDKSESSVQYIEKMIRFKANS